MNKQKLINLLNNIDTYYKNVDKSIIATKLIEYEYIEKESDLNIDIFYDYVFTTLSSELCYDFGSSLNEV